MKRLAACFHFTKWPTQWASSARGLRDSCLMTDFPSWTRRTGHAGKQSNAMTACSAWDVESPATQAAVVFLMEAADRGRRISARGWTPRER